MRITTLTTIDQREAVTTAGIAASLLDARFNGTAALAEFASEDNTKLGYTKYLLLNVWGAGEDHAEQFCSREHLWCGDPAQGPSAGLSADDVARIQTVIRAAGDLDPNIFGVGDLAGGVFDFDIAAVLAMVTDGQAEKLIARITELGVTETDLDDLIDTAACPPDGEPSEVPDEVTEGGIAEQARFLIQRLGFEEAWAAVAIHRAA